jgi:release factor glutamine methyltransferase
MLEWLTPYLTEKGIESPRLTAELLIAHVLEMPRIQLYVNFDKILNQNQLDQLRELIKRTANHEPFQYLIGRTEFYSLPIQVSPDVLIPRPETELLVERAIEFIRPLKDNPTILDLCTGSGCIAVVIAKNVPNAKIIATDISEQALQIAEKNIRTHNLENSVKLLAGNLFEPIIDGLENDTFDLIVSNPPYVCDAEYSKLAPNVREYEPKQALHGGSDGLEIYRKILAQIKPHLKPNAALMLEIGCNQGLDVKNLIEQTNIFKNIKIEKDLSNNDRIIIATQTPPEKKTNHDLLQYEPIPEPKTTDQNQ